MTPSDASSSHDPASCQNDCLSSHAERLEKLEEVEEPAKAGCDEAGSDEAGSEAEKAVAADEADEADEVDSDGEEEPYESQPEPDPFLEIREELAAAGTESRRTARRQMEVLKEFGTAINAVGNMVRDLHSNARASVPKSPSASGTEALLLPLIELADRLARASDAFRTPPAVSPSWWPGYRTALASWQSAWDSQKDALFILRSHMDTLLTRAGLERIPAAGSLFDPATMSAVEVHTDSTLPDHTVISEILSGWRLASSGRIIRPAQVKVSRR